LVRVSETSLLALKWLIVVDWASGRTSAETLEGVEDMLEYEEETRLEVKNGEKCKPKGGFHDGPAHK